MHSKKSVRKHTGVSRGILEAGQHWNTFTHPTVGGEWWTSGLPPPAWLTAQRPRWQTRELPTTFESWCLQPEPAERLAQGWLGVPHALSGGSWGPGAAPSLLSSSGCTLTAWPLPARAPPCLSDGAGDGQGFRPRASWQPHFISEEKAPLSAPQSEATTKPPPSQFPCPALPVCFEATASAHLTGGWQPGQQWEAKAVHPRQISWACPQGPLVSDLVTQSRPASANPPSPFLVSLSPVLINV